MQSGATRLFPAGEAQKSGQRRALQIEPFEDRRVLATFVVNTRVDEIDSNPGDGLCDTGSGGCSFRAAVMEANSLFSADVIMLPSGVYDLTNDGADEDASLSGDLDVVGELSIHGVDGVIIDASSLTDRAIHVLPSLSLSVTNLTIRGGNSVMGGGGIFNESGTLTLTNS